jgi:hypothetical protein
MEQEKERSLNVAGESYKTPTAPAGKQSYDGAVPGNSSCSDGNLTTSTIPTP